MDSKMNNLNISNPQKQEINLLILGETGVGKSTFINGFVNYLTFDTLDEAEKDPNLLSLIKSSFTVTNSDTMEMVTVKTGDAANENFAAGQSATQSSQVYRFELSDSHVIRIIDTPGIGDVRGIQKDQENFQNILHTISNLDYLHGILILLKPNNARLGVMFRFCIQELLTHLHKSAVNNIVFGFTNSRGTFYAPGDTMPALQTLLQEKKVGIPLKKETIYCFDSESYRFLAALKHGVPFNSAMKAAFSDSWNYSVKETRRLIEHILQTPPHPIHDTTSLNSARNLIIKLTKPLAEVTRLIDVNKKVCQDKIKELNATQKHGKELDQALMVKKIDLEPRQLGFPRTVCTNKDCIEVRDWEGIKKVNYKTHCHEHCYLEGVQVDTLNTPLLIRCDAMQGGQTCKHCNHGYQEHMHVVYELIEVSKTIEDANIKSQIDDYASEAQKKEAVIAQAKQLISEYEQEHKVVETAAAQFGCFLKYNAILPYSDARIEYLDHLLNEERAKAQVSGDNSIVKSLEETKQMYLEEFRIIDKSIGDGKNMQLLDPKNVAAVEAALYKLKHFGKTLKKVRDAGSNAHKVTYNEIPFQPPNGKKSTFVQGIKNWFKK